MIRAYDEYGNIVDLVEWEKHIRATAINDFVNACKEDILCQTFGLHANGIERIAEQLKAGVTSGTDNQ